ncbi:melanocyte-stimulating hormone receptor-like [Stylophora pistillata]|uniref:melanocyte-stimulating hormone receptor-like n=1 Tax=Stylophora pistillata TaxID=50429 RepID=UPI000C048AA0|nr:melanocyte-stimulating hormone receptor-like [Stylophora pistillata]
MEIMMQANLSANVGKQTESLLQLRCVAELTDGVHKQLIFLAVINIFLSITAFLGNTLILVALYKESSLHPPSKLLYRCLATTDLCVGLITEPFQVAYIFSLVQGDWKLCRLALTTAFLTGYSLSSVSLLTMTAISVDRLLALLLGLRYRQVVTLKRTYVLVIILWVKSMVAGTSFFINHRIAVWFRYIIVPLCLVTSAISYTKIFWTLYHNQNQVQVHVLQQPSQPAPLNMARYRKAVYSALWVQLVLVVCYLPFTIAATVLPSNRLSSSQFIVQTYTVTLIHLNSSLNPLLYCRRISGVRQAVKEVIRHALCCPRE